MASMAPNTTEPVGENVDTLADLEERINRAVQVITQLRSDNDQLQGKLKKAQEDLVGLRSERDEALSYSEEFQKENGKLEEKIQRMTEELDTLREDRKQVKNRIEKLLGQLDLLSAS
jgi:chromosome segregation ATPase